MKAGKRNFTLVLGLMAMMAVLWFSACDSKSGKVAIGREVPNFTYQDMNNETRNLHSFKGKTILLRFWADWCPYCHVEMPIIDRVYQAYKDKGFVVLAVNVKQSSVKVKAYVTKYNLSFPVALDLKGEIAERFNVHGLPMNFLINREGVLKDLLIGGISDKEMLEEFLKPYLS